MLAAINWGAKLGSIVIGLFVLAGGIWFYRFGDSVITALNRDYARLPFKFQYPSWWHRFMGGMFVAFGLLSVTVGIVFGWR